MRDKRAKERTMGDVGAFQSAHDLAEKLYTLQSAQADRMLDMLTTQAVTLGALVTDVAVVKEQTKEVPTLKDRIKTLEEFKWKMVGWIGAAALIGWLVDHNEKIATLFK
jgi:hypothetical protein